MAIHKRNGKTGTRFQIKLRGSDGLWITETYASLTEARKRETELKHQRATGLPVTAQAKRMTLREYFDQWFEQSNTGQVSAGWRNDQQRNFATYIEPVLGATPLAQLTPAHIARIFVRMNQLKRAPQTQLHVYNVAHKMLGDAVDMYRLLQSSPVTKNLRPKLVYREVKYLTLPESVRLLNHVRGKPFETAIALGLLAGLRVGETQALKWEDIDFERRMILVKGTYVRKERTYRDYPKNRAWRRVPMTPDLVDLLRERSNFQHPTPQSYVAADEGKPTLNYQRFFKVLQRYCRQVGLPVIGTHGLRHSASEIFLEHGGSRDDLRMLYRHASGAVTDRYVHDRGQRLTAVAQKVNLRLIPGNGEEPCSQNVPKSHEEGTGATPAGRTEGHATG